MRSSNLDDINSTPSKALEKLIKLGYMVGM